MGLVVFSNITAADNGAGPKMHIVNGKDNGAGIEFSWIVDDRNRANVPLDLMAGACRRAGRRGPGPASHDTPGGGGAFALRFTTRTRADNMRQHGHVHMNV